MTKSNTRLSVTVFIPTYNGEEYIYDLLEAVFRQDFSGNYEVLIIDSGSSDGTLDIISKFPAVRLHQIPNSEFGHGKTRNLAAKMAHGKILVLLTQDAVPVNKNWLKFMVEPFFINKKIYCVYGRQIPRKDCVAIVKREVLNAFNSFGPEHSIMLHRSKSLVDRSDVSPLLTFFSDVNSAVSRDYLLTKIAFRDVDYSEDQALGKDIMDAGYIKTYTPFGCVLHSHNYKVKKYFHRKYDEYRGLINTGHIIRNHFLHFFLSSLRGILLDWKFTIKDGEYSFGQKLLNLCLSPLYNSALFFAIFCATSPSISKRFDEKLSLEKNNS